MCLVGLFLLTDGLVHRVDCNNLPNPELVGSEWISRDADLYRNLTQKRPFLASKNDPPPATQIFEKVAICVA